MPAGAWPSAVTASGEDDLTRSGVPPRHHAHNHRSRSCSPRRPFAAAAVSATLADATIGLERASCSTWPTARVHAALVKLLRHGERLFAANFTVQEGAGRPLTKAPALRCPIPPSRSSSRATSTASLPRRQLCAGCHNAPFGIAGGGGDIVANVFVLGQRFDHMTFDHAETAPTVGATDENGDFVTLASSANSRATLGMFGSGYIEMLARQMTATLQAQRNALAPGQSVQPPPRASRSGGSSATPMGRGTSRRSKAWPPPAWPPARHAAQPHPAAVPPGRQRDLVAPVHEQRANHHHGIQATERFGIGTDPDGDGFRNELTRADVTAVTLFRRPWVPGA
jgi:hypothetical protein